MENVYNVYFRPFTEKIISAKFLEVPHETHQRPGSPGHAAAIAADFDVCLLNDPKVNRRDGHYYVFDGQNTLDALRLLHDTDDFPVRCRLYEPMSLEREAELFSKQFGNSRPVPAGYLLRAELISKNPEAIAFKDAVEKAGLTLGFTQKPADNQIGCIKRARKYYGKIGPQRFTEALSIMKDAWNGEAESLRGENLVAVCLFVDQYWGEYDRERLVRNLRKAGAMHIYQKGSIIGSARPGDLKYFDQVLDLYTATSSIYALPSKL